VLRLRERATAHARHLCESQGVQLLDDSGAYHRQHQNWRLGTLHVMRESRFETRRGGDDRQPASVRLLGDRIVGESMPAPHHPDAGAPFRDVPGLPVARHAPGGDTNIVPITRARRTLH
jgi:hypothetical protein